MDIKKFFLDFEEPIAEVEHKIEALRYEQKDSAVDISSEIDRLQKKHQTIVKSVYRKLSPWQISQVARHPQRPFTNDYIKSIFSDFQDGL